MNFKQLSQFAESIGWHLQKNTDKFARYEVFSNEFSPGVTIICNTLEEVQQELAIIFYDGNCKSIQNKTAQYA